MEAASAKTAWITGLSGAGKTTLARALRDQLLSLGRPVIVLDGDEVRSGLCADLGFSKTERSENIRRVAHICRLLNQQGLTVIAPLISPLETDRLHAEQIIGTANFLEVYVSTPLAVCEERDPKGLYRKARSGTIKEFTGLTAPYEPPISPDFSFDMSGRVSDNALDELVSRLIDTP